MFLSAAERSCIFRFSKFCLGLTIILKSEGICTP